jgi:hypothetical protein
VPKSEFIEFLQSSGASTDNVHFENCVSDGYYLLKRGYRWEVFFRERGYDYDCVGFPSESDALVYLAGKLRCR